MGCDTTSSDMYYHWRCEAECIAMQKSEKKVVSLEEIILTAPSWMHLSKDELIREEMRMEREMLRPIPSTLSILKKIRKQGYRIVFISDMYLPSSFLQEILSEYGFYETGDRIFVSCEWNATKSIGTLYDIVQNKIGERIIFHYGDNDWSDIKMAKRKGIKPIKIKTAYSKAEQYYLLQSQKDKHANDLNCIIGCLRYARLTNEHTEEAEMSADFVAPIWTSYCLDILNKAQREKLDRLYFLARDGYILHWTSKLYEALYSNIDMRYLYVSRKSMFLPSITKWSKDTIESYFGKHLEYTSKKLIYKYFKQDENTAPDQIAIKAEEARERINGYFRQEGIFDITSKYALVDVGWKGSSRVAFNNLQKINGFPPRDVWYWGTFSKFRNEFEGKFYTYNINLKLPLYFITLIEDFFSTSPDLSTLDYQYNGNKWEPIFDNTSRIDNTGILSKNKYCLSLLAEFIIDNHLTDNNLHESISKWGTDIILNYPEFLDLNILASMNCFSESSRNGRSQGIVKRASLFNTILYILGKSNDIGWIEADLAYTYGKLSNIIKIMRRVNAFIVSNIRGL